MFGPARGEEREAYFVQLAIDGPEVGRLEFARLASPGLDRGFVHGLDARCANRIELRLVDRFEQGHALLANLGEPRAAHRDAGIAQALVLAVERQVVGKLVDQHSGDKTHVRSATLDHTHRRTRADDDLRRLELDHRAPVFEHDATARTLGEPIADLVIDDFVVFGCQALGFGSSEFDDLDGHSCLVEEGNALLATVGLLRHGPPRMGGDEALNRRGRRGTLLQVDRLPQAHLGVDSVDDAPFALLAEHLTLEPVELMLEGGYFLAQREVRMRQLDDLPGMKHGRLVEAENTGWRDRRIHALIIPTASAPWQYL